MGKWRKAQPDARGQVMVQVRLPPDLVRQLDHVGIDVELSRQAMLEAAVRLWLAHAPPRPPRGGRAS